MSRHRSRFAGALVATVCAASMVGACARPEPTAAPQALHVVGTDYAFLMPDSLPEGLLDVSFENRGAKRHELVMVRLKDSVSTALFADSLLHGTSTKTLRATGSAVLFADPGENNQTVRARLRVQRGQKWAFICQFRDTTTAPKHFALGMFKVLEVK